MSDLPEFTSSFSCSAKFDNLAGLLGEVHFVCRTAGLNALIVGRVELVIEEAFSNSIHHGYGGESDRPVWLTARILGNLLELVYQDAAPAFDPLLSAEMAAHDKIGGVGRILIQTLPCNACYERIGERNSLILQFGKEADGTGAR